MKIYIAGKITGMDKAECFNLFLSAENWIIGEGWEPVNPLRLHGINSIHDFHEHHALENYIEYLKKDFVALMDCDGILLLRNWWDSKGARIEKEIAKGLGLKISYYHGYPLSTKSHT